MNKSLDNSTQQTANSVRSVANQATKGAISLPAVISTKQNDIVKENDTLQFTSDSNSDSTIVSALPRSLPDKQPGTAAGNSSSALPFKISDTIQSKISDPRFAQPTQFKVQNADVGVQQADTKNISAFKPVQKKSEIQSGEREMKTGSHDNLKSDINYIPDTGTEKIQSSSSEKVIQLLPKWFKKLFGIGRENRKYKNLVSDDDRMALNARASGRKAEGRKEIIEAQRRDKVGEGGAQIAEEAIKMGLDVAGMPIGVPFGTIAGAVRSAQSVASAGHQASRVNPDGQNAAVSRASGKAALEEGVGEALGNIPVIGEVIGMGQGAAKMAEGLFESDKSRGQTKQSAIDEGNAEFSQMEEAREILESGELEHHNKRRTKKAVDRYDASQQAGKDWQKGKGEKGKLPLLSAEALTFDEDDEEP